MLLGFLLNQSVSYTIAVSVSFIEFNALQKWCDFYKVMPSLITMPLMALGLSMIVVGHVFRIGAEFTAGSNFNHKIQFYKDEKHELVTHGLYSVSRHPSYFGWFLWAVGT